MPQPLPKFAPRRPLSATWTTTGRSTTRGVERLSTRGVKRLSIARVESFSAVVFLTLVLGLLAPALAAGLTPLTATSSAVPPAPWHFVGLPARYAKPATLFDITEIDGKRALRVRADKSYGNLMHEWSGPARTIHFKWRLDTPLLRANIKAKGSEDIALKVCLTFDLPVHDIPLAERTKFKLAQLLSHDKLPTSTVCYIWDHALPVGSELHSPYTSRVHYIVLNSGEAQLKTWQEHQRNIHDDFLKAFGHEASTVPGLTAIIVGADSDNTGDSSLGYVTDLTVQP